MAAGRRRALLVVLLLLRASAAQQTPATEGAQRKWAAAGGQTGTVTDRADQPLTNLEVLKELKQLYVKGFVETFRQRLEEGSNLWGNGTTATAVVVATTVTWPFIDFFENWVCSLKRLEGPPIRFVVFALDNETYDYLVANGYNAVQAAVPSPDGAGQQAPSKSGPFRFRTEPYYSMIQQRNKLVFSALVAGFSVLLVDIDAVWLSSPLTHIHPDSMDIGVVVDNPRGWLAKAPSTYGQELCGGFVFFRSCAAVHRLLLEVGSWLFDRDGAPAYAPPVALRTPKVLKRFWMPRYFHNEQKLLSFLIHDSQLLQARWRWAKVRWLPKPEFPSGQEYFEKYGAEERSRAVVVHNNYIATHAKKKGRFQSYGFWYVRESTIGGAQDSGRIGAPRFECRIGSHP